jgi:hypothetical protein
MDDLIEQKNALHKKIQLKIIEHNREIKQINIQLENINNKIYETCSHTWGHDRPSMYDKMETYCTTCGLYLRSSTTTAAHFLSSGTSN